MSQFIRDNIIGVPSILVGINLLAFGLVILIMMRPSVWGALGFELGLCRTGILFCFLIFFLPGMFNR